MNDYTLVRAAIARTFGTPEEEWDTNTATDVDSAIRRGINSVIHNQLAHQWSWMRPVFRFATSDGQRRYALPADFEQFIDHICFDGDNYKHPPLEQMPSARLHQLHSEYSGTGVPTNYALEPRSHDGTTEQVQEVALHPTPNGTYELLGVYQVGPIRELSTARPWFPGGPENLELFMASCLAQAEVIFTDGVMSTWRDQFQSELAGAIARDHRKNARNLGPMKGRRGHDHWRHKLQTQHEGHVDSV